MDQCVACVFLLCALCASTVRAWPHSDRINFVGDELLTMCGGNRKPCKMLVRDYYSNGSLKQEYRGTEMCRCRRGDFCPEQWDQSPRRSLTRYLRIQGRAVTLQLKFCRPVQPETLCTDNEVALTLKGRSVIPQEVTSVNCRCPDNRPMHLQRVWFEPRYEMHQNFTCTMAQCDIPESGLVPCQLNQYENYARRETIVLCQCPAHVPNCRILEGTRPMTQEGFVAGYCNSTGDGGQ